MTDSVTESVRVLAGRYQVGELIGRGGMADVHIGTDARLGRRVAIKLLKPSLATDPAFRTRFRQEAQAAARMAHPTIVRVFDAGEETVLDADGLEVQVPFIVMEHVDGRLLKDIIADGPLEPKEAVRIISGVLTALEYSHRAGVIHRDIKPGNIMVTPSGQVKVMDFGIARAISETTATVAQTSAILGTAQYFSPEQARGEIVDVRTDLYSAGVVLFEMLTGRPPFVASTPVRVAYQHVSEPPVPPSTYNPAVSPALDAVVLHALAKDRFERYQSAADFREDANLAAAGQVPAHRVPSEDDASSTLFGAPPSRTAAAEAAVRQLTIDEDDRVVRTQNRPPVAWIWAGIAIMAVVLIAVGVWVFTLSAPNVQLATSIPVPNVVGQTWEDGSKAIENKNLMPTRYDEPSANVPAGRIIRTEPSANSGERLSPGQQVVVWVSSGPEVATVPTVTGLPVDDARVALTSAGFVVQDDTVTEPSDALASGLVTRAQLVSTGASSAPAPAPSGSASGTAAQSSPSTAPKGATFVLYVSSGQVDVPNVVGMASKDASALLGSHQLTVRVSPDGSCSGGTVSSQSAVGDQPQHSTVTIRVCVR